MFMVVAFAVAIVIIVAVVAAAVDISFLFQIIKFMRMSLSELHPPKILEAYAI